MSVLTPRPPSPPRPDDRSDVEALEALIEEARRRARRRRLGYAALLVAVAAALIGYFAFNNGGGSAGTEVARDGSSVAPRAPSQPAGLQPAAGIEGASISALAVDPHSPETVFAATDGDGAGLFKSANGGRTWEPLTIAREANRIDALAIAPGDPQTVYAGTGGGVFKTTDGGATWQAANGGLFGEENAYIREHRLLEGYAYSLVVDPRDAETVYTGTRAGILKTTNGGASWQRLTPDLEEGPLVLDPNDPETIYGGGSKSTDGGTTWQPAPQRGSVYAVDPVDAEVLYAVTAKGLLKSSDGGNNWHAVGLEGQVSGVTIDPERPTILYARNGGGIFKSRDGGRSWTLLQAGREARGWNDVLVLDPSDSKTLYAGSDVGVLKSTDSGRSWKVSSTGMTGAGVDDVAAAPGNSAYALVSSQGLFKRAQDGWGRVFAAPPASARGVLAVDPQSAETLYVATRDGRIFGTSDGGDSWRRLQAPSIPKTTRISALAVDPQDANTLYAGTIDSGGLRLLYNGLRTGVFKSTDGGASWRPLPQGTPPPGDTAALAIDPLDSQNVYAAGKGVFRSGDGGATWEGPVEGFYVRSLALDPSKPATMYAVTGSEVFKSTSGGTAWRALDVGFEVGSINALVVDPQAREVVYVGTDSGLFVSSNGGENWRRYEGGDLLARGIGDLAIDPSGRTLYIGGSAGMFELSIASH